MCIRDSLKTVKHYVEYGMEEGAYDKVESPVADLSNEVVVKVLEKLGE